MKKFEAEKFADFSYAIIDFREFNDALVATTSITDREITENSWNVMEPEILIGRTQTHRSLGKMRWFC